MMRIYIFSMFLLGIVVMFSVSVTPSFATAGGCPVNMAPVATWCVDTFEASAWSQPPKNNGDPQGQQFGTLYPCEPHGNDCSDAAAHPIYAASVPGVTPSRSITWFQAQQACANVGKQLLPNAIWQMAAAGTPDTGMGGDDGETTCNTENQEPGIVATGSRSNCVSNWGIFDMVGNVTELVADWIQGNSEPWDPVGASAGFDFGEDAIIGVNPAVVQGDGQNFPAALNRGGHFNVGSGAGVFALGADRSPSSSADFIGFRCAQHR